MRLPDEREANTHHECGRGGSGGRMDVTEIMSASHIGAKCKAGGRRLEEVALPERRL
jgi:hypothetical protein